MDRRMTLTRMEQWNRLLRGSVRCDARASRRLFASVSSCAGKLAPRVCDFGIKTKSYHWALLIVGAR